jgi:hypothetical protein
MWQHCVDEGDLSHARHRGGHARIRVAGCRFPHRLVERIGIQAGSASAWIEFAVAAVGSALLLGLGYALWVHDERSRRVTVGAIGGPVCFLLWEAIVRSCNGGL